MSKDILVADYFHSNSKFISKSSSSPPRWESFIYYRLIFFQASRPTCLMNYLSCNQLVRLYSEFLEKLKLYTKLGWNSRWSIHIKKFIFDHIICRFPSPIKVFLELANIIMNYWFISKINIRGQFIWKCLLVASNANILLPLSCPLRKVVNDSKSYMSTVPMIMSFKVLKYFSSGPKNKHFLSSDMHTYEMFIFRKNWCL